MKSAHTVLEDSLKAGGAAESFLVTGGSAGIPFDALLAGGIADSFPTTEGSTGVALEGRSFLGAGWVALGMVPVNLGGGMDVSGGYEGSKGVV